MAILDDAFFPHRRVAASRSRTKSPRRKKRLSLHKNVMNDTELHIPRAYLWKGGNVSVCGVYTGMTLLAVNHEVGFDNLLQPKRWTGKDTLAKISEVDPYTGQVGRIVAIVRRENQSLCIYTYFPSFRGQKESFTDKEFVQDSMYLHGEFVYGRAGGRKHCFSRIVGLTKAGTPIMRVVCQASTANISVNPLKRLANRCNNDVHVELQDPESHCTFFVRDRTTEITTIMQGQNMIVGVCLSYAMDFMANPSEGDL